VLRTLSAFDRVHVRVRVRVQAIRMEQVRVQGFFLFGFHPNVYKHVFLSHFFLVQFNYNLINKNSRIEFWASWQKYLVQGWPESGIICGFFLLDF